MSRTDDAEYNRLKTKCARPEIRIPKPANPLASNAQFIADKVRSDLCAAIRKHIDTFGPDPTNEVLKLFINERFRW